MLFFFFFWQSMYVFGELSVQIICSILRIFYFLIVFLFSFLNREKVWEHIYRRLCICTVSMGFFLIFEFWDFKILNLKKYNLLVFFFFFWYSNLRSQRSSILSSRSFVVLSFMFKSVNVKLTFVYGVRHKSE